MKTETLSYAPLDAEMTLRVQGIERPGLAIAKGQTITPALFRKYFYNYRLDMLPGEKEVDPPVWEATRDWYTDGRGGLRRNPYEE